MSTSDGDPASLSDIEIDVVDSLEPSAPVPGFPGTAELTRMASEMFAAMSGMRIENPAGPALVSPPIGGPSSSSAAPVPIATMPPDSALRSGPALASGLTAPPPVASPPAGFPSLGGYDPSRIGDGTSYYFLDGAAPAASPDPPAPASALAAPAPSASASPGYEIRPELVPAAVPESRGIFDAHSIRKDFPILDERIHGRPLIWLDNAATTQKPRAVIERIKSFYEHENSNVHRGAHTLAARSTDAYEAARDTVRRFLNAGSTREIIWVRGATEGINLIANTYGARHVGEGDEIVLTRIEHHSNIVPWQMLCRAKGARLKVAPVDDSGQIILEEYERLFTPKTRIVSLTHVSNALGTITPVREMIDIAHRHGAKVVVDGAQAVSHLRVDVQALDCDFYVFSGHKVFGPTGIGVVYGKESILEHLPPWQGGGNMIADVTFEKTAYMPTPWRFEAGTGNIADAVGLGAALDYLSGLGLENVMRYEHELLEYATACLLEVPGLTIIGTAKEKASVISLVLDGHRSEDVGQALDAEGIAVRSGHHCAQPALRRFGLESSVRPSLAMYNTREDVDALVSTLKRLQAGRSR